MCGDDLYTIDSDSKFVKSLYDSAEVGEGSQCFDFPFKARQVFKIVSGSESSADGWLDVLSLNDGSRGLIPETWVEKTNLRELLNAAEDSKVESVNTSLFRISLPTWKRLNEDETPISTSAPDMVAPSDDLQSSGPATPKRKASRHGHLFNTLERNNVAAILEQKIPYGSRGTDLQDRNRRTSSASSQSLISDANSSVRSQSIRSFEENEGNSYEVGSVSKQTNGVKKRFSVSSDNVNFPGSCPPAIGLRSSSFPCALGNGLEKSMRFDSEGLRKLSAPSSTEKNEEAMIRRSSSPKRRVPPPIKKRSSSSGLSSVCSLERWDSNLGSALLTSQGPMSYSDCHTEHNEDMSKSGYLSRKNLLEGREKAKKRGWTKQWVVLRNSNVFFFKDDKDAVKVRTVQKCCCLLGLSFDCAFSLPFLRVNFRWAHSL